MRIILLFAAAFLGASVAANGSSYGWPPAGTQLFYRLESQVGSFIKDIRPDQAAGIKLVADVIVEVTRKSKTSEQKVIWLKIEQPKFYAVNEEKLPLDDNDNAIIPPQSKQQKVPEQFLDMLTRPFKAETGKGGVITALEVSRFEGAETANIKRSVLSQLQLDIEGVGSEKKWTKQQQQQEISSESSEMKRTWFKSYETNINGVCKTHYTVLPLSQADAIRVEREMLEKEQKMKQQGISWNTESQTRKGEEICSGKKYYEIIKAKDFDDCKFRPVFMTSVGMKTNCISSRGECADLMAVTSTTRMIVCGESRTSFLIRRSHSSSRVITNPLGWNHTPEKMTVASEVSLTLVDKKSTNQGGDEETLQHSRRGSGDINDFSKRSLVFEYAKQPKSSGENHQQQQHQDDMIMKRSSGSVHDNNDSLFPPIRPFPDMSSASNILSSNLLPTGELAERFAAKLAKLADALAEKSQGEDNDDQLFKTDAAGEMGALSKILRPLSASQLKEVETKIVETLKQKGMSQRKISISKELYWELEASSGSNPALTRLAERVRTERNQISEETLVKLVRSVVRNALTPTPQMMSKTLELARTLRSDGQKKAARWMLITLSDLAYSACVDEDSKWTRFPAGIYGEFCTEESHFFTNELIPHLERRLNETGLSEDDKLAVITALGKTGHRLSARPLARVINDNDEKVIWRMLATHSLKRLAKRRPAQTRRILLAVAANPAEYAEVRQAAIAVLPWAQPTVAEWITLAANTWGPDSSKQVRSFLESTLKNLKSTKVPELITSGKRAGEALKSLMPSQTGAGYAHNLQSGAFVPYLMSVANSEISYTRDARNIVPARMSVASNTYGPFWEINGPFMNAYTQGMDKTFRNTLDSILGLSKPSEKVKDILSQLDRQLGIGKHGGRNEGGDSSSPKMLLQFGGYGYERTYAIDIYHKLVEAAVTALAGDTYETTDSSNSFGRRRVHPFSSYSWMPLVNIEVMGPTENGFLLKVSRTAPQIAAAKGEIEYGKGEGLRFKVNSILESKVDASMAVVAPFNPVISYGAGVKVASQFALPIDVHAKVDLMTGKAALSAKSAVKDKVHLFRYEVEPFTFKKDMRQMVSDSRSDDKKTILTGKGLNKNVIPYGRDVGVSGEVRTVADSNVEYDFAGFVDRLSQHDFHSWLALSSMAPSAKMASVEVEYDPAQSQAKEFDAVFKIVSGKHYPLSSHLESDLSWCAKKHSISSGGRNSDSSSDNNINACRERQTAKYRSQKSSFDSLADKLNGDPSGVYGFSAEMSANGGGQLSKNDVLFLAGISKEDRTTKIYLNMVANKQKQTDNDNNQGQTFEIENEFRVEEPHLLYRWDVNSMLDQDVKVKINTKTVYGNKGDKKTITIDGDLYKTEQLKKEIRDSAEYAGCRGQAENGRNLASVCEETRHKALSVDSWNLNVVVPKDVAYSWWAQKLQYAIRNQLKGQIFSGDKSGDVERASSDSRSKSYNVRGRFNRVGDELNVTVSSEGSRYQTLVDRVRVAPLLWGVFPLSMRDGVTVRALQKATRAQSPASCRIDYDTVYTFDNTTYKYSVNDCEHLVFKDCWSEPGKEQPIALTLWRVGSSKFSGRFVTGEDVVELNAYRPGLIGGVVQILLNGKEILTATSDTFEKRNPSTGELELSAKRFKDGVVSISVPHRLTEVWYDGHRLELSAPAALLKDRSCGLCGDNNGENAADIRTPKGCVYSKPRFAAYTYMLKDGKKTCSGIPEKDRDEFEKESGRCVSRKNIKTDLDAIIESNHLVGPVYAVTSGNIVERNNNRLCISKQAAPVCSRGGYPTKAKVVEFDFVCTHRPSEEAERWAQLAEAGEYVDEISFKKVTYRQKVMVPTKCSKEPGRGSSNNNY